MPKVYRLSPSKRQLPSPGGLIGGLASFSLAEKPHDTRGRDETKIEDNPETLKKGTRKLYERQQCLRRSQ
jgi:hypothetical protein